MSISGHVNESARIVASPYRLLLSVFAAAIFASAALLFAIEPMFTKMVLPVLGGSASVWSTAMVFFQAILLAGYVYAHFIMRVSRKRTFILVHLLVMLSACAVLPVHVASGWGSPPASGEAFWLLGLFMVSIGLPFFALSANGSLLQAWFARTGHPAAKDPYFLYVASNAGSFLALVAYPVLIEPFLGIRDQSWLWAVGYCAVILLVAACGTLLLRFPAPFSGSAAGEAAASAPSNWRDIALWAGLAAVPSGLLLAVTAHISTDVAAVPLFWVAPLALYLLAFIIAFQTHPLIPHALVIRIFPAFIVVLVIFLIIDPIEWIVSVIAIHLSAFFVVALLCHGELARRRPPVRYLTNFYMWISTGGVIGAIATGLVAPHVFSWVTEYPLLIVLAIVCSASAVRPAWRGWHSLVIGGIAVSTLILIAAKAMGLKFSGTTIMIFEGALLGLTVYIWQAPLLFAAVIAFVLFTSYNCFNYDSYNFLARNFFGVLYVTDSTDGRFRTLWHGTIGQGAQRIRDNNGKPLSGRPELIAEFFDGGGIAQVMDAVDGRVAGPISYAVIGLGTGTLACRSRPGDRVTYYEIDPDVIRIATDPRLFSYFSECAPQSPIIQGDARRRLAEAPDQSYDLIFVDAFLGAAIPVHLLTREAISLYFRKLKPDGIVAVHVSNRNLELASVVVGAAEANSAITRVYLGGDVKDDPRENKWVPHVAVAARSDADFGALAHSKYWPIHKRDPNQDVWSDDYSNILAALIRQVHTRGKVPTIN